MSYTSWSVVFGEQPSAAKWNILGTNDASFNDGTGIGAVIANSHLLTTAGQPGGAWKSYTPTFTNTTLGSGTVSGSYMQLGKTVFFKASFTLGAGSAVSTSPLVSFPVTAVAHGINAQIGNATLNDSGVQTYLGNLVYYSTTTAQIVRLTASTTYVQIDAISSTTPFTWGSGDFMSVLGVYEAA